MATAYILDAARTPRGKGKPGKGALSGIHPQELLAQTLEPPRAEPAGIDTHDVDDVVMGCVSAGRRAGREHRAQRRARRRLALEVDGRHAQPLLRLGPAGGQLRGDGRPVRRAAARRRRRRREHVARADGLRRRRHRRQQPAPAPEALPGAAGHQRRPDRHPRRLHPRGGGRLRAATRSATPPSPSRRAASSAASSP